MLKRNGKPLFRFSHPEKPVLCNAMSKENSRQASLADSSNLNLPAAHDLGGQLHTGFQYHVLPLRGQAQARDPVKSGKQ
jgi:hypothetical protein